MISKKLLYLLVLLLPANLGKHFDGSAPFISGVKVDYLIPVIYTQDLIVLFILLFWAKERGAKVFSIAHEKTFSAYRTIALLLMFSLLLSCLMSPVFGVSLSYLIRFCLYTLLSFYIYSEVNVSEDLVKLLKMFFISSGFVAMLGILQFFHQGSVFDNYLVFGEQPYSAGSRNITKESFFGVAKVPSYGLFRHPNTFGGYLSIFIVTTLLCVKRTGCSGKGYGIKVCFGGTMLPNPAIPCRIAVAAVLLLSCLCLLFTFSYFSVLALIMGTLLLSVPDRLFRKKFFRTSVLIFLFVIPVGLPLLSGNESLNESPSFYRRAGLLSGAYNGIKENPLFGAGFGAGTLYYKTILFSARDFDFYQPVHNIFILMFYEAGVFAFILYTLLFVVIVKSALMYKKTAVAPVYMVIFLGGFDHYFLTMHQPLLLFFIMSGILLAGTKEASRFLYKSAR